MATKSKKKKPRRTARQPESRLAEARVERAAVQVLAGMCAGMSAMRFGSTELYEEAVGSIVSRAIDVAEELIDQLDGLDEDDEVEDDEDDEDEDDDED